MKAILRSKYGSPDVLELKEIEKPVVEDDDVLVRVRAASLNHADLDYLYGRPFLTRMGTGLRTPRNRGLGLDVAGQVEAVGTDVTRFKPGDEVFGDLTQFGYGAFAEYACAPERAWAHTPAGLTFEKAATVPQAAILALQSLRGQRGTQPGGHEGVPMTTPASAAPWTMPELTPGERVGIRQSAAALERRWKGRMNVETIERFMVESLELILPTAKIRTWTPIIVERLTNDRLRALVRLESDRTDLNPSVLFLCVHNAGRSQMAAGWMRHLAGDRVDVFSGGSLPATELNQAAVAAMAERGIDISAQLPQPWADEIVRAADVIVSMGCGDACPVYPGKRYLDWELDDPAGQPLEAVRPIRDEIERRVRGLLAELGVAPAA